METVDKKISKKLEHWQVISIYLAGFDFVAVCMSYFVALWVRFDCVYSAIPKQYLEPYKISIAIYAVILIFVFRFNKLYSSIWRYASYDELLNIFITSLGLSLIYSLIMWIGFKMPISYCMWGSLLQLVSVVGIRFSYRLFNFLRSNKNKGESNLHNVMIIGAGDAGLMLLRDIASSNKMNDKAVCIIDDNSNKWGRLINGVPVVGGREDILSAVEKYNVEKIYFAIPSASATERRDFLNICKDTGCELKYLPAIYQLMSGDVTVSRMKEVTVEELLGREPIKVDLDEVFRFINNKVVLVTGGGGSIGSELCRQIAGHHPKQLIILDVYENNAYDIQLELQEKYPELDLVVRICSVRDSRKMFQIFEKYHPQIVYHAAAHKHVPLMEDAPCEAIKNNSIGTYKTAYAAMVNGCERFVLISTDKAVNPTNIMGASKRLCEMIIQSFDKKIKEGKANEIPELFTHEGEEFVDIDWSKVNTEFVAVRFGNVLGSNGSVIPLFKKQIRKGGPVTVTHPDIIRYFMTIPEAVSLVLTAGTYAKGGEIFVLDMGSPVRIDTLARNLIKLSGLKPDEDIKIVYTGLRPGEKLYEEKLMSEEGLTKTDNEMIFIGKPLEFDTDEFLKQLPGLMDLAYQNKSREIKELVSKIVTTYHPIKRKDLDKVTIDEGYKNELEMTRSIQQIVNDDDQ